MLKLSCLRVPSNFTLEIQATAAVGIALVKETLRLRATCRTSPETSRFATARHDYVAFDTSVNNLCAGQLVSVTVTRTGQAGAAPCAGRLLWAGEAVRQVLGAGEYSTTCNFTMNVDQSPDHSIAGQRFTISESRNYVATGSGTIAVSGECPEKWRPTGGSASFSACDPELASVVH